MTTRDELIEVISLGKKDYDCREVFGRSENECIADAILERFCCIHNHNYDVWNEDKNKWQASDKCFNCGRTSSEQEEE